MIIAAHLFDYLYEFLDWKRKKRRTMDETQSVSNNNKDINDPIDLFQQQQQTQQTSQQSQDHKMQQQQPSQPQYHSTHPYRTYFILALS